MPAACVNTAQISDSLSTVSVPPQLLPVLRAVAASISTRGWLSTFQSPHTLLLSPIQMVFITERNLPTGASCAWKCHPEIQGRDDLLCVRVVWVAVAAGMG